MRREKCPLELTIPALRYSKTRLAAFGVAAKSGAGISMAGAGEGAISDPVLGSHIKCYNEKDCIRSAQSAGHRKRPTHRDLVRWEPEHFGYNSLN
jgi:hypothetical protein